MLSNETGHSPQRAATLVAVVAVAVLLWLATARQAGAEKTDPDLIPPDVTIPLTMPPHTVPPPYAPAPGQEPAASTQPAPGQPGTASTQPAPGQPGAASTQPTSASTSVDFAQKDPLAVMETSKGTITIRLFRKFAPSTVEHFINLVNNGFYNGLTFHRREPGFVIQGGCPNGNGSGLYTDPATGKPKFVNLETHPSLRHNAPGVVALARFGRNPNSGSCQFYITLAACPQLDNKYSIFGGVTSGMEVVRAIVIGDKIISIKIQDQ